MTAGAVATAVAAAEGRRDRKAGAVRTAMEDTPQLRRWVLVTKAFRSISFFCVVEREREKSGVCVVCVLVSSLIR